MKGTIDRVVGNEWVRHSVDQAKLIFGVGSAIVTPGWALGAAYELSNGNIRGAVGLAAIATLYGVAGYYGLRYFRQRPMQR